MFKCINAVLILMCTYFQVEHVKLEWNAKSKVGSLDYATHKPGGGDKKIITQKVDFKNVQSKVGSKDNLKHKPGGGAIKVSYSSILHS